MASKDVLTDDQKLFVAEYVKDRVAKQAAIRAGYSAKTAEMQGSRLLSIAKVRKAVNVKLARLERKLDLSPELILRDIEAIKQRCLQGEPVVDREGNPTGEWRFEAHNALKACELQGKHLKMFTDRLEADVNVRPVEVTIRVVD